MDQITLDQGDVWDDSVLIDNWKDQLEEYKKYHSIQAKGGTIEEVENDLKALRSQWDAKPETEDTSGPIKTDNDNSEPSGTGADNLVSAPRSDETPSAENETGAHQQQQGASSQSAPEADFRAAAFDPHSLMGTVHDDEMKTLLLSWYYAGYHTGIHEGRQQQKRLQEKPSEG